MKKLIAVAAALLISAFAFADGFTNKINLGGVYSNTDLTLKNIDLDFNFAGAGLNVGWRGAFPNGLTILADMDIMPAAKLTIDETESNDYMDVSFAIGIGYEWTYDKGCIAIAGVYGGETASREDSGVTDTFTSYFLGANLYATCMFTKNFGIYGECTAGISTSGEYEVEGGADIDIKAGDLRFAPKAGVVFKF